MQKKKNEKLNKEVKEPEKSSEQSVFLENEFENETTQEQNAQCEKKLKKEKQTNLKEKLNSNAIEANEIEQKDKKPASEKKEEIAINVDREIKKNFSHGWIYFYITCFLINIVSFAIFLSITSQQRIPGDKLFKGSPWWLVLAFASIVVIMLVESFRVYALIRRGTTKRRFLVSVASVSICRFYDLITPLSTGGQYQQINFLIKNKMDASKASSIPMAKFVYAQFCYTIFIIVLLATKQFHANVGGRFVGVFAYIGLAFQFLWMFFVLLLSVSKKIGPAITIWVLKVANKLKIIKDYKETYLKVIHYVSDYQKTMRKMFSSFGVFLEMFVTSFGIIILRFSIVYFLYCAFGLNAGSETISYLSIITRIVVCELAMGVWILPGNVIFADLIFYNVFKDVFVNGTLFWALFYWRFITYYMIVIIGAITIVAKNIYFAKKEKQKIDKVVQK